MSKQVRSSIFTHDNLCSYLSSCYLKKKKKNRLFSLRSWARLLGYNSPSYLSQDLKGERKANLNLLQSVVRTEELLADEEDYLKLLYIKHSVDLESDVFFDQLLKNVQSKIVHSFDLLSKFDCFASWIPFFIVEYTKVDPSHSTRDSFVQLLAPFVEAAQVDAFLDELVKADFLVIRDGVYSKNIRGEILFEPEISHAAIKLFHHSSIKRAENVLFEQDRSIRDIRATIVALNEDDYLEACRIIRDAHKQISGLAANSGKAKSVYQFNSQLYMPVEVK